MQQEQTVAFDLLRMFVGTDPPLFYLEIVVRIATIYLFTLVLLRWVGSRTIAQLSTVEFLLVIALGSAVGDAMFYPEVPLLHAMLVITGVVLIDKGIDRLIYHFSFLKMAVDGEPVEVIRDGVVNLRNLAKRDLSVDELHEMLRLKDVSNLGEISFGYIESSGQLSIFRARDPRKGLPIVPLTETITGVPVKRSDELATHLHYACTRCGTTGAPPPVSADGMCACCQETSWIEASEGAASHAGKEPMSQRSANPRTDAPTSAEDASISHARG